MNISTYS